MLNNQNHSDGLSEFLTTEQADTIILMHVVNISSKGKICNHADTKTLPPEGKDWRGHNHHWYGTICLMLNGQYSGPGYTAITDAPPSHLNWETS